MCPVVADMNAMFTGCQQGEVMHEGVCYGLTADLPLGFNEARRQLVDRGDLVRVTSGTLNAKMHAMLTTSGAGSAYIGLTDQFIEGECCHRETCSQRTYPV